MEQIKFEQVAHIITEQDLAEKAFLAEFEVGAYTLENPLVKLNPYRFSPLTAMILFRTPAAAEVTVCVKGKEVAGDISHTFPSGKIHVLPIYGLYADYENTVELVLSNGEKSIVKIKTEALDPGVPVASKIETTAEYMGSNLMFVTAALRALPAGYDYAGDIRWYSSANFAFDLKRLENGHILIGTERLVKTPYFTTGLYEMAFSGKIFKEYQLEGGYHHDQFEMEDGNILALTFDFYSGTVEDMCVLLDRNTGEVLKSWDYKKVLPQYPVAGSGSQDAHDWFHNNAVWYDKATHSLSFSGRHQDAVINLDYETGDLNWIIGDPTGWPQEMVDKYFFTPVGENFEWQYEQHACVVLPDGDVFLFDNGHFKSKIKENYAMAKDSYSRGVRYRIDREKMTIEQVWQYGKERGADFFSPYICNVEYYSEGHYMVHSGGIGYEDGKPCEGLGAILALQNNGKTYTFNSITCELVNDEVVYELHVPANCYRAEKLPLYYAGEVAELGKGQLLGQLVETKMTKMKMKVEEAGIIPESYKAELVEEEDRIKFSATFDSGAMAQVLLTGAEGEIRRYPIDTVPHDFQAMCVGTFQKEDLNEIDTFINKRGLKGQYTVQVVVEDKLYETGVTIEA